MNFLYAEKDWIIDNLFAGRNIADIAHGLVGQYSQIALFFPGLSVCDPGGAVGLTYVCVSVCRCVRVCEFESYRSK